MAHGPSFTVYVRNKLGDSLAETMHDVRAWLDHRKIRSGFRSADPIAGFEIAFSSEDEARLFVRE